MRRALVATLALICVAFLSSCGGSGETTTTVIREVPAETTRQPESTVEPTGEPPNVEGLPLPAAKQELKRAGYRTAAKNTDTTFGIIDPSNYTICEQGKPRGDLVVVLAQKYGC